MKYVFFGTPRNAAMLLEQLIKAGYPPVALVCNPDRPAGRKKIMTAPATKICLTSGKINIPVFQPEKPIEIKEELKALGADIFIVLAYGSIIPPEIAEIPRYGTIGVHPSLLPKYRGPSPIQSVLLAGETETGVTLYLLDAQMDHGRIISNFQFSISNEDTNITLEDKCSDVAAKLLIETLPKYISGEIKPVEQNHAKATVTHKFTTADGQVDMVKDDPKVIYNKIRAFNPEPSVWTLNFPGHINKRVKLLSTLWQDKKLVITKIQLEGKTPISI